MIRATELVTRQDAMARGLPHYFTGKPCKQGHVAIRLVADRKCAACNRMRLSVYRTKFPERVKARNDAHYAANRTVRQVAQRAWNARNAERAAAYARQYRESNPNVLPDWRRANRQLVALYTTTRRAAKLKRTPAWADKAAIEAFYLKCPPGYEVDHIIPLRGKLISGLHIVDNLQYLTRSENARKRNKFDIDAQ